MKIDNGSCWVPEVAKRSVRGKFWFASTRGTYRNARVIPEAALALEAVSGPDPLCLKRATACQLPTSRAASRSLGR